MQITDFTATRGVNLDASASVGFTAGQNADIDQVIVLRAGYTSQGDSTPIPILVGQITGIDRDYTAENESDNFKATLLSPLKNFRNSRINTDFFETMTGEQVLTALCMNFAGWRYIDFSACAGTFFKSVRVCDDGFLNALVQIAEACMCELIWLGDGTIKAIPLMRNFGNPLHAYTPNDVISFRIGDSLDISAHNTLVCRGKFFTPQNQSGLNRVVVSEREFSWYSIASTWNHDSTSIAVVTLPLDKGPATGISVEVVGTGDIESVEILVAYPEKLMIQLKRPRRSSCENINFSLVAKGFLYTDSDQTQLKCKAVDHAMLARYGNIESTQEYENVYVQTKSHLEQIAHYRLRACWLDTQSFTFTAPHNPGLNPGDMVAVNTGDEVYTLAVRSVTTSYRPPELTDEITGWLVGSRDIEKFQMNVVDSSGNYLVEANDNNIII